MLWRSCAATALLLVGSLPVAQAQQSVSGEVGSTRLHQDGLIQSTLITSGTGFSSTLDRVVYASDLLAGRGVNGVTTATIAGSVDVYAEALGRSGFEASVLSSIYSASGQHPSTSFELALKQLHQGFRRGGYWAVTSGARIWESNPLPMATAQIGGWIDHRTGYYSGAITALVATPDRLSPMAYGYIEAADVVGGWRRSVGSSAFSFNAGVRLGLGNINDRPKWAQGSFTQSVTSGLSLIISGGRTPQDLMVGIPATRYASISFKSTWTKAAPVRRPPQG